MLDVRTSLLATVPSTRLWGLRAQGRSAVRGRGGVVTPLSSPHDLPGKSRTVQVSDISPKGENHALGISRSMRIQSIMTTLISSKVKGQRELLSASGTLRRLRPFFGQALRPSIFDKAFKGHL